MTLHSRSLRPLVVLAAAAGLVAAAPAIADAAPAHAHPHADLATQQVNLVSDLPGASLQDPDVVNPWGLALSPTSPLWVANQGTSTSTLYSSAADTTTAALVSAIRVTFPGAQASPTGQVFNGGSGFVVSSASGTGAAPFIFDTLGGHIEAWNPAADGRTGPLTDAASVPGASFTGLAIDSGFTTLFAADFERGGIDVFDSTFHQTTMPAWAFRDPFLPAAYHPFNIQQLGGNLFVAYAKHDPMTHRDDPGVGHGFVDEFSTSGRFMARIVSRQTLDSPWGLAMAPAAWGDLAGSLLVGNFGNGRVNVVPMNANGGFHHFVAGQLRDSTTGTPLAIEHLWALLPGTASTGGADSVWFSAGIGGEQHGLLGVLRHA